MIEGAGWGGGGVDVIQNFQGVLKNSKVDFLGDN